MKLSDLMTAKQALEIIELLNSIDKRLTDLEKKVENLDNIHQDEYNDEIKQYLELWNNS